MDANFKSQWLNALRGDKYQQCRDDLADGEGGFCCIGVGYEVLGKDALRLQDRADDPTDVAAQKIGLTEEQRKILVEMNDGTSAKRSHSFKEIADYIEANL